MRAADNDAINHPPGDFRRERKAQAFYFGKFGQSVWAIPLSKSPLRRKICDNGGMKPDEPLSVKQVFSQAAPHYDWMNDIMSLGLHRLWKQVVVDMIPPLAQARSAWLLDVAAGSGDIAWRALEKHPGLHVCLCDPNQDMLALAEAARAKAARSIQNRAHIIQGDGAALPLAAGAFDYCTISFGLRNIADRPLALREMFRVLRPGGRFFCLEFNRDALPLWRRLYHFYSDRIIPQIASAVSGDPAPYEYLVESIRRFPTQAEIARMISAAGFSKTRTTNLTGGIAVIYSAVRI